MTSIIILHALLFEMTKTMTITVIVDKSFMICFLLVMVYKIRNENQIIGAV